MVNIILWTKGGREIEKNNTNTFNPTTNIEHINGSTSGRTYYYTRI